MLPTLQRFAVNVPRTLLLALLAVPGLLWGFSVPAPAQQKPEVAGDYAGTLGPLHVRLHLKVDATGAITGSLDSPDQGANGIPCSGFKFDGHALSFSVPAVGGTWAGTVENGGTSLVGTWNQGSPMPLNFARDTFVPAAKPSAVDGVWLGTLVAGSQSLRIQLQVKSDRSGKEYCALDSLDQGAMGLECANVLLAGDDFSFEVPAVGGHGSLKLSADHNSLSGTWRQGSPLPITFARQSVAIGPKPPSPPKYDPAMAPVAAAELQSVLDRDLAEALKSGELAPSTGAGASIAVVEHGVTRVFSYGTAKPDSIFEIGSVTKTFTGLVLSQMVEQGKVKFDDPVRELLPAGTVAKPAGSEITLLDLATQHSGLPRLPDNLLPADDPGNPYAAYGPAKLYAYLAKQGVAKPAHTDFLYSNLGFGLLGQALAVRSGQSYPALLREEITGPLGLKDTTVSLSPEQQARFMAGHDAQHHPAKAWDFDALAGCGAIRSTAPDLLAYVQANLHPENVKPAAGYPASATLTAALVQSHELRADAAGMRIALAWLYEPASGNYWHNGGTGGYTSYVFFNPKGDYAAVVLLNTALSNAGSYADRLGQHISQRLAGKPAISLGN